MKCIAAPSLASSMEFFALFLFFANVDRGVVFGFGQKFRSHTRLFTLCYSFTR